MKLKEIKTIDAIGHKLCHDITQIIPGEFKGSKFKKGHIVKEEDIEVLLSLGKDTLYVWEEQEGYIHENDGAMRLANLLMGDNIKASEVNEGKINLIAEVDGLLKINRELLITMNSQPEIICATKRGDIFVKKNEVIAGTRVIPLIIEENKIEKAEELITQKILSIKPILKKKVAIVTTGNEVYYGRIKDRFKEVLMPKLDFYNCEFLGQSILPDNEEEVTNSIKNWLDKDAELILCTGGMSVDPGDITPTAIINSGSEVISYGVPILSGCMTLIAYKVDVPIIGIPAGTLFADESALDVILPRLLANDKITASDVANYGEGGLL